VKRKKASKKDEGIKKKKKKKATKDSEVPKENEESKNEDSEVLKTFGVQEAHIHIGK
jgi:hypothetical protein